MKHPDRDIRIRGKWFMVTREDGVTQIMSYDWPWIFGVGKTMKVARADLDRQLRGIARNFILNNL